MTRKITLLATLLLVLPSLLLAGYTVVMKDGQQYKAREKYVIVGGKAVFTLENGTTLTVDPKLIDSAASEKVSASTMGGAKILATPGTSEQPQQQQSSLGSITHLRQPPPVEPKPGTTTTSPLGAATGTTNLSNDVIGRFQQAYENVGLFDAKVIGNGTNKLRVELTADNEDQLSRAISATAYLITKIPEVSKTEKVEMVELFLKTINGGSAGKFQMTDVDAKPLSANPNAWTDYFVKKVIF